MIEKENKTNNSSEPKRKQFEESKLQVIHFDGKDVITTSPVKEDIVGIPGTWVGVYGQQ